jgi:putative exporter of polyketide antibiotics
MVVTGPSCHTGFAIDSIPREPTLEIYNQVVGTDPFEAKAMVLGILALLVGLIHQSETFDRLVSRRIKGPLYLAYGTYGVPLMLLLMEIQRRTPRRSGGGFRILGVLLLVVLLVILGVVALIAFLVYRYLRRRR